MTSPTLTGSRHRPDDRRAPICLMTVVGLLVVSPHPPAQADGRVPRASLIERAAAAPWIPRLTLGVGVARAEWPRNAALETLFYGSLSWPLEHPPPLVPALGEHRARERARASHVARLAEAWRRRRAAA